MRVSVGFILLILPLLDALEFRPDYQYNDEVDGWMKYHRLPATWQRAQFRCDLEGAVLASPTNEKILEAMKDAMKAELIPLFIGIHATFSKDDYFTVTGIPLSKIPVKWAPNQPDNLEDSEECLILHPNGTMADVKCGADYPYICYRERTDDMPPVTECDTIDPEYHFEPRTGSCYKYHSVARNWSTAFMTCTAEGGHLAIVNSPLEAQVFKDMYDDHPKTEYVENRNSDSYMRDYDISNECVYLGFREMDEQQNWLTINGETLKKAGYSTWMESRQPTPYSPNYYSYNKQNQYCGSMEMGKYSIGLRKLLCFVNKQFICEKVPKNPVPKVSSQEISSTDVPDTTDSAENKNREVTLEKVNHLLKTLKEKVQKLDK